jgi:hypothetical protein
VADVECVMAKLDSLAPKRGVMGFKSEQALLAYVEANYFRRDEIWAALVFDLDIDQADTGMLFSNDSRSVVESPSTHALIQLIRCNQGLRHPHAATLIRTAVHGEKVHHCGFRQGRR